MATLKGIDVERLESLVKKHFGPDFTCRMAWNVLHNRYVASDQPRRLVGPKKVFGVCIWWKTVGEFSENLGFRLEIWDPTYLRAALALAEEYNAPSEGPALSVHRCWMSWPASSVPSQA